jgi:hypothetical protein
MRRLRPPPRTRLEHLARRGRCGHSVAAFTDALAPRLVI